MIDSSITNLLIKETGLTSQKKDNFFNASRLASVQSERNRAMWDSKVPLQKKTFLSENIF